MPNAKAAGKAASNLATMPVVVLTQAAEAKPANPTSGGNPLWYLVYAMVAFLSPWFWGIALLGWPVAAYLLPRRIDEDGKEHWRWRAGFVVSAIIGWVFAFMMVMLGFQLLPYMTKALAVVL